MEPTDADTSCGGLGRIERDDMGEWVVVVWLAALALMIGAVVWKKMNE